MKNFKIIFFFSLFSLLTYGQVEKKFSNLHLIGKSNYFLNKKLKYNLIPEVADSFDSMRIAALSDGIEIKIISSYRSFNDQKSIWNRKFLKNESIGLLIKENIKEITKYSTIPGTSRHHWGTDIDIIDGSYAIEGDVLVTEKFYGKGPYVKLRKWLEKNAERFGFYLVYTNDKKRTGFNYEPWHYSYAPISIGFLNSFLNLNLDKVITSNGILGNPFLDSNFIEFYKENYVLGINPALKVNTYLTNKNR